MASLDFPSSPSVGQQYTTSTGVTWVWDGVKWTATGAAAPFVLPMNDNRICNGDMRIDQRNNGASGTAINASVGQYTVDRWVYGTATAGKGTWGRNLNAAASAAGFPYYLGFQSSSAYASAAGDYFYLGQRIEADMVSDLAWGTANAQPVTLSFWAQSNLGGTFSGALNGTGGRAYPFTFTLPGTATWTKVTITVPGDTNGTWTLSGNASALVVMFDLGCGSTFRGPANAWATANYVGVTSMTSVVANNFGFLYVTGVKLEIGSVATPFNRQSLAKSMADCQRYYQTGLFGEGGGSPQGGVGAYYGQSFAVQMRSQPTLIANFTQQTNCASSSLNASGASQFQPYTIITAAGGWSLNGSFTASAEL